MIIALVFDTILLFATRRAVNASRTLSDRFSNGDENKVIIEISNNYNFSFTALVIDEIPVQFQQRKWIKKIFIERNKTFLLEYYLKPVYRGEYDFGNINIYVSGPLRIVRRRFTFAASQVVKVYPSYQQMRRYQLLAGNNQLLETGVKRVRKLGHSMEFEQIKEYVRGDDYRTINWKATARKGDLMVNSFTDERSQQIYCVINKGRLMKMPFKEMSLLDYAINATLVLCNVAITKHDKAGLITFAENTDAFITADKSAIQMNLLLEALYKLQTRYLEADYQQLYGVIRNRVSHRSLLVLFTNFESVEGLERELPALKQIARYHLLMVIIFENTELKDLREQPAFTIEDIYIKTIAEKYATEKKLIVKELRRNGILAILTTPQNVTVNALNKYLELKAKNQI